MYYCGRTSVQPKPVRILTCLLLSSIVMSSGCEQSTSQNGPNSGSSTVFSDDLSASAIFEEVVRKYRQSDQYSDRAVLYMSYRLNGRPIQEPQPWAVAIDNEGRFSADFFNSQIRSDGKLLSCYVYDIETGNLDDQWLLIPVENQLPLSRLYDDNIAKHFVGGFADMPLDEVNERRTPPLVPPTIGLLTGQLEAGWMRSDVRLERYEDSEIDGRPCFVLRCWQSSDAEDYVDLWVDKDNSTIWQAGLPTDCLAEEVRTSPEIENLRLVARFHEATFAALPDKTRFAVKSRPNATKVTRFVKLPEPLNSELIGLDAPEFQLEAVTGERVTRAELSGKSTALLWIGSNPTQAIESFDQLHRSLSQIANFGVVYSNRDLATDTGNSTELNPQLRAISDTTSVPFYFDRGLQTSMKMQLKSIPGIIVIDADSKVQFALAVQGDQWPGAVEAALQRIDQGDQVGSEMLAEYQRFLDEYHKQLIHPNPEG